MEIEAPDLEHLADPDTGEIFRWTPTGRISKAKVRTSTLSSSTQIRRHARKHEKFMATMRTNMALVAKSPHKKAYDKIREELGHILDQGILSYPQTLSQLGLSPSQTLDERKLTLGCWRPGIKFRTENEEKFLKGMEQKAMNSRKANWSWRIAEEAEDKHKKGWFPFFVTLTVDPKRADPKEIWTETNEFQKYLRKLTNVVCKELGDNPINKPPYRKQSDYLTYCGVIEHGKSRLHHHGHFLIWLRAIPSNWRICPNLGIRNPKDRKNNICRPMSALWTWSGVDPDTGNHLSPAMYFRTQGDIWEKVYKFVLPIATKGPNAGQPMKVSTPRVAGAYITKYISKDFKEWHHRMKATRNLGMQRIKRVISTLPMNQLEALSWRAPNSELNHSLMTIHSVPLGLLRSLTQSQIYYRKYINRELDIQSLLASNSGIFTQMLKSVQSGARPERMRSSEFYDWVARFLPDPKGYCKYRQIAAHTALSKDFPLVKRRVEHTKIGGNVR